MLIQLILNWAPRVFKYLVAIIIRKEYKMKKSFKLENLHCANCAAKMEDKINKLNSVTAASIGFMSMRMNLEADDMEIALEEAQKAISSIEPGCKIVK